MQAAPTRIVQRESIEQGLVLEPITATAAPVIQGGYWGFDTPRACVGICVGISLVFLSECMQIVCMMCLLSSHPLPNGTSQ